MRRQLDLCVLYRTYALATKILNKIKKLLRIKQIIVAQ